MVNPQTRLRLGVSSCLLGERVRYDGGHKRHAALVDTLGERVEWVPVCPEVEVGLGTPRAPIQLVRGTDGATRVVQPATGRDLTGRLRRFAHARVDALERLDLDGYVFKRGSPSCGLFGVPVHDGDTRRPVGRGVFAQVLTERLPDLPVEEEGPLDDHDRRAAFLDRVRSYHERRRATRDGAC